MGSSGSADTKGLRILVVLSSDVKIYGRTGTKTLIDPRNSSNSWTYNIWELQKNV